LRCHDAREPERELEIYCALSLQSKPKEVVLYREKLEKLEKLENFLPFLPDLDK